MDLRSEDIKNERHLKEGRKDRNKRLKSELQSCRH